MMKISLSERDPNSLPGPTPEEFAAGRLVGADLEYGTKVWIRDWLRWDSATQKGTFRWLPAVVVDVREVNMVVDVRVLNSTVPDELIVRALPVPLRFSETDDGS